MTFREILRSLPGLAILIGLALGLLWSWEQGRKRRAKGLDLDTTDPIWLSALEKARTSLLRFKDLAKEHPKQAFVKYPLRTTRGRIEHVWGQLISFDNEAIVAGLDTPPVDGKASTAPPYEIPISQIEDWRVDFDDGRILGAYTARAHIEHARKHGLKIPEQMLEIERRLVDA